ncbi:MAG: hypothetical protein K8U57_00915 [Planctomycetes bacterium]|nr:hypothetical protein [Planctomycetota bacterium]
MLIALSAVVPLQVSTAEPVNMPNIVLVSADDQETVREAVVFLRSRREVSRCRLG